jgi:tetratricopeptide (TPR) repeat protein
MSCRYYFWAIILVFASCASLFDRRNDFERGLLLYNSRQYSEAIKYFNAYHIKYPDSDSVLYYLFNCYRQLDRQQDQTAILEKMAARGVKDENVYLNLTHLYRKNEEFGALYNMLMRLQQPMSVEVDKHLTMTRRLLAELICGATTEIVQTDPMVFCISKGYLPISPDGQLYEKDILTTANIIVLLDRLVEPVYPHNLYHVQQISTKSYLYLPYMRLVDLGILEFDAHITPDRNASVITTVRALDKLSKRRRFD